MEGNNSQSPGLRFRSEEYRRNHRDLLQEKHPSLVQFLTIIPPGRQSRSPVLATCDYLDRSSYSHIFEKLREPLTRCQYGAAFSVSWACRSHRYSTENYLPVSSLILASIAVVTALTTNRLMLVEIRSFSHRSLTR